MEKIICDRCNNYEVSNGGFVTKCHAVRIEPFSRMSPKSFYLRESGEKTTCKSFVKLPSESEN